MAAAEEGAPVVEEEVPAPDAAPAAAAAPAALGNDAVLLHLQGMGQAKSAEISAIEDQIKEMKKEEKRIKYDLKLKKEREARIKDKAAKKNLTANQLLQLAGMAAAKEKAKADAKANPKAKGKAKAKAKAEAE